MSIQLRDFSDQLLCKGIILKRMDINEKWHARVLDFESYGNMYVKGISACDNDIVLEIQKEPVEI